ncbi:MAG: multiubiquitin domain-containing protein [Bryobacteraceae bacterium]|jgi:hypothetical protein
MQHKISAHKVFFGYFMAICGTLRSEPTKEGSQMENSEILETEGGNAMPAETERSHVVRIHIDQEPHHSPNSTTGTALYALGKVEAGFELFREVTGDKEDPDVLDGPETIHLKEDQHFHTGERKTYTIYVNGQPKVVATKTVTYEQIVALAFPNPHTGQNMLYTVGYEDGPHQNPSGSLMPGGKVRVKDGMIFNVTPTDKS